MTVSETLKYSGLIAERYELARVAEKLFGARRDEVGAGADEGWFGVGLDEGIGGSGGVRADLAPMVEAAGSMCAATALTWSSAVVGQVLGDKSDVVGAIASGAQISVPISAPHALAKQIRLEGGKLRGEFLAIGEARDGVLVPFTAEGIESAVVITDVEVERLRGLDQTRSWSRVNLDGVSLEDLPVASGSDVFRHWETSVACAFSLDAAGAARSALERTISYSLTREQFGRAIGSFQAYKHRVANMFMHLKLAQSLAFRAADELDAGGGHERAYSAAYYGTSLATKVCGEAVQLHGGIGFTWEAGLHEYLKRSRADQIISQGQGVARAALSYAT